MIEVRQFSFDDAMDFTGLIGSPALIGSTNFEDLKNNYKSVNYISFDGLGIDLENENKVFYESGYAGFMSADVSGNTKTDYGYELINITSGLIIDFSSTGSAFPTDLTLLFYGHCCSEIWIQYMNIDNGAAYDEYIAVTDADAHLEIKNSFQDMATGNIFTTTSFRIVCLATPLPNQAIKLQSIVIGKTNLFNKIKSANLWEEINILSDDLPVNSFECDIVTDDSVFENDVLIVYSNNKFYGNFFVDEVSRIGKNLYSVKALNSLSRLDNFQFEDWNNTIIQLDTFLKNLNSKMQILIERDEPTTDYWAFGYLPINTYRYTLCAFAYACRYMVDSSRIDGIRLINIPTEVSSVITNKSNRIIGECTFTANQVVTEADYEYPWDYSTEGVEIATENVKANDVNTLYFENAPVRVWQNTSTGDNASIEIIKNTLNYIRYRALEDNPTIKASKLSLLQRSETVVNINSTSRTKPNVKKYNTFNIRGYTRADGDIEKEKLEKENDIQRFISSRGTASARIIVEDEKVGDLIQIETAYDGIITGIIISMNTSFGYKDVADIEVLEWQNG